MKKLLFLVVFSLIFEFVSAQNETGFKYQAVVRDNSGELLVDQSVGLKLSIIDSISDGDVMYTENHQKNTNSYGVVDLIIGDGTVEYGVFTEINWGVNKKYLKLEVDIGSGYTDIGTVELLSVPYALYANSASKLGEKNVYSTSSDTLFVVKDHSGNVVFAVYPDGAEVIVDNQAKGKVGGFAVSGRNPNKAEITDEFLRVTRDSTRVTFNQASKGKVGGFAVSGRNPNKAGSTSSIINLFPDNYFIGDSAGINKTSGVYNSFFGYQAGYTNSSGSNNLFLGYKSGYSNVTGGNNVFIGTESGYVNQFTFQNTYVGYRSGYDLSGAGNTAMGSMAGENAGGGNNTFIGTSAGRIATGGNNTFVGNGAGYSFPNENTGVRNTYIGQAVGSFTNTGSYNVMLGFNAGYLNYEGSENTFLGYDAGRNIHEGSGNIFIGHEAGKSQDGVSDKLFISNWDDLSPLIYGDFNLDRLSFNGNVGINRNPYSSVSLSVSPAGLAYGIYVDSGSSIYAAYFNGSIYTTGTYESSDEKFKKNIVPVSQTLMELSNLNAVYYDWKTEEYPERKFTGGKQIGFIAQEVEKSFPEIVKQDAEGNKSINYSKFTPILVEAIKEQQNKIDELEERLKRLEELIQK